MWNFQIYTFKEANQRMKRKVLMVLSTVMIMNFFTGCVKQSNNRANSEDKIKIGICVTDFKDKFLSYMVSEMKNYSKSLIGVEIEYVDSKKDSNVQLEQAENFIDEGVDVLVVNPVDRDLTKPISDKAKAAGIPIISFNNEFDDPNEIACSIQSDSKQSGILEMEYLANKMNYKGNVAIIMGTLGQDGQRLRTQAFHEVIEKYPDMKIVAEQTAGWSRSKGMALMEGWLESGKDIDIVACENDEMAIGAIMAIEKSKKSEDITVGGIDATPEALDYLKAGKLAVTVSQNLDVQSQAVLDAAVKIAKGEKVDKAVKFPNELVTPENVNKYMSQWES
jgi:inositol transport system substrate-binding protein